MSSGTDATLVVGHDDDDSDASELPSIPDVTLERELGRGGMGAVWLGRQELLDRQVAVKMMLAAGDKQFLDRFKREARILANLAHPNIVSCYHAGLTDLGHPYMVMEFVDGPDLKVYIEEHGPLSDAACLRLADEIATGLGHACAQQIIHRDVKPENILLAPCSDSGDDLPYHAKVADLGLARPAVLSEDSSLALTAAGMVLGTPATMSPEQFDDPDRVDHRSDIYGLGCILYHARCGRPAFESATIATLVASKVSGEAPDPRLHCSDMDPRLAKLIRSCLARSRDDRPESWESLRAMLQGSAGGAGLKPLLLAVAVILIVVVAGLVLFGDKGGTPTQPAGDTPTPPPVSDNTAPPAQEQTPPADQLPPGLQRVTPLLGDIFENRFEGWETRGALWDSDAESSEIAIIGIAGTISRPLPAVPLAIEGEFTVGEGCNGLFIGIDCTDGRHFGLWLNEVGSVSAFLGRWEQDFGNRSAEDGGWNAEPSGRFRLEIHPEHIVASIDGGEPAQLTLPAAPQTFRLYKEQDNKRVRINKLRALPLE